MLGALTVRALQSLDVGVDYGGLKLILVGPVVAGFIAGDLPLLQI